MQWDETSNMSYTLKITVPYIVSPNIANLRQHFMGENIILTENFVNEKFLIDYQRDSTGNLVLVFS
jgi:hypothetical protein